MEISFSQSFLTDLERIDNNVVMDECEVRGTRTGIHVICHENVLQACIEGVEGECERLDFYYNRGLAFTITGENIKMNPERTIFEITLPSTPKATIDCTNLTEDTKFLESVGTELGNSLYKDIKVSDNSLIWKESIGKYIIDRGLQDNHSYDVELLDTKSGILEERPIRFKSYQNIIIDQGNWRIDTTKKSNVVKHDVYSEVSSSVFFVWDSPMIDATVDLDSEPDCKDNLGEYLDPGNVVFGNTNCFQYINFQSNLVGFRITGTEGSKVSVLMNRESSNGNYTSFDCIIGEDGVAEVRFSDLPYYHFNGVQTTGPSRITKIESIQYLEETIDVYVPNPEKTYVVDLKNTISTVKFEGTCDYIEYEKYLGDVKELGRGTDHINSVPGLDIEVVESGSLDATIDSANKQISVKPNSIIGNETNSCTYRVVITNNINVNGNIITTSPLYSDYNVRLEQTGVIWKLATTPEYINEDGHGIYTLEHTERNERTITILTNHRFRSRREIMSFRIVQDDYDYFSIDCHGEEEPHIVDGESWYVFNLTIMTLGENDSETWRPKTDSGDPRLVRVELLGVVLDPVCFYLIQLRKPDTDRIQIWEETLLPGKFSKVDGVINIYNTLNKNFVVVKKALTASGDENIGSTWYYYDLSGRNKFYITDTSTQITNVGSEFLLAGDYEVLDLGTGDMRSLFSRVINVNRSDIIGSLGTLTITESPAYPGSWRDLIDNNTINIEVTRELDNIYILVGNTENSLDNKDITISLSKIQYFDVYVRSNFKYVSETFGYLRFLKSDGTYDDKKINTFTGYNNIKKFTVALTKIDTKGGLDESFIEFRSGSIVRRVYIKVEELEVTHDWLLTYPGGSQVDEPNLVRIFNNGSLTPIGRDSNKYLFTSTTTPKISFNGVSGVINNSSGEPDPVFGTNGYGYHTTDITLTIPNSLSLSRSKYPMESFGYVSESSLSYSELETEPLKYNLYMKGKEHFLWCVESLGGFSNLQDPNPTLQDPTKYESRFDMTIDANGESGKTVYVVSRYSVNNRTFITEYPEETEFKVKRDELEANIKISPQQNIGLDERSQIEYAIPIQVSCNVENNKGNIFLGSLDYKAETKITDDSLSDVIEVDSNIATLEDINSTYIDTYITKDKTQNLSIMIFQLGSDKEIFSLYSRISDLGIWATSNYIIPEIGSDYTITGLEVNNPAGPRSPIDGSLIGGEDIVTFTQEWDPKYFLIKVDSKERVRDEGNWHWYNYPDSRFASTNYLPMKIILDTDYIMGIKVYYLKNDVADTKEFYLSYKKYGCNYGLYVGDLKNDTPDYVGFGVTDNYKLSGCSAYVQVPNEGGSILIHAGIFHAVNGIESTEALMVPSEYKFIGENQPIDFSWTDGNLDDNGNLRIVLPPRTRDEDGSKEYILEVVQPHEYYPIKLYVTFYQTSLHDSDPNVSDTGKEKYKFMFLDDHKNILSNGTIEGDDKFHFVSNLPEAEFNKVTFDWVLTSGESFPRVDDLNVLNEVERSYKEGYVKFEFKPNGNRVFLDAKVRAKYQGNIIGSISVRQGYFCLISEYQNPKVESTSWISDYTPYKNPLSRLSPYRPLLYSYRQGHGTLATYTSNTPCKSNNDNSNASYGYGRAVYELSAYKREYYDDPDASDECDLDSIFNNSEIVYISPERTLESYGLSFVNSSLTSSSDSDPDAKVNPRFFEGDEYITGTNFGKYSPYLELSYLCKEEFIRESITITASGKIRLKHPDTKEIVDFYLLFDTVSNMSDEPADPDTFELSDYKLKFGYQGGSKQISYQPQSFNLRISKLPEDADWLSYIISENSNIITVSVTENNTKTEPEPSPDTEPEAELEEVTQEENVSEEGETEYAFYRTAQIKIELIDDRNGMDYIMRTVYIDVEQEPDYTASGEGPQHVIMDSSIRIKSDEENPVMVKFPNDNPLDINVTNNPLPVSIDGSPTVNLAPGASVDISNQPISVTGTVEASNIPTDYARQSDIPTDYATSGDVSSAESNIISSMPSCKYTPPSNS